MNLHTLRRFVLVIIVLLGLFSCQQAGPQEEQPLSATEKAEIEASVKAVLDTMVEGMEEHDVDKILSHYQKGDRLLYSGNGTFAEGWDSLYALAKESHSDPANALIEWSMDEVRIEILGRDLAILTASGERTRTDEEGIETTQGYSLTDVLIREDGQWIIINEHESLECPTPASEEQVE
jgi:uncharacterized protein (TIGR02246 family)